MDSTSQGRTLWEQPAEPSTREPCQVDKLDRWVVWACRGFACTNRLGRAENLQLCLTSHHLLIDDDPCKTDGKQQVNLVEDDVERCSLPEESCHTDSLLERQEAEPSL
jgi:hypothetical protein